MRKLIMIGASGHGKVCADVARLNGYENICFLDDNKNLNECNGFEVVGIGADYKKYVGTSDFFVAIGNAAIRKRIIEQIEGEGGVIVSLIHPSAVVASDVSIVGASVVMAGVVINSGTRLGKGVIVNTCSSVDHDCVIGDFSHISVGSHLCGTVVIGQNTWVGAGATVLNNLNVCGDCVIGAGAVVVRDITILGTYAGVPAKRMADRT